jgi:2'-5' RNA ligase
MRQTGRMGPRRRLGVALVLDPPVADEVDGLRRSLGDPALGRIPPHLTLVPPVNVRGDDFDAALGRLRAAAAVVGGPLVLTMGRPATFWPANPVIYLSVGGDLEGLRRLRDAVFVAPLERPLSWPWVPHVTLADSATEERIGAALVALSSYSAVATIDRVVMLEEGPGRIWAPVADVALGRAFRIGTGGLALDLVPGRLVDPRLAAGFRAGGPVVNAYRDGEPVAWAALDPAAPHAIRMEIQPGFADQGIDVQLLGHMRWLAGVYSKATAE